MFGRFKPFRRAAHLGVALATANSVGGGRVARVWSGSAPTLTERIRFEGGIT
jgi:hypothetical protein